MDSEPPSPTFPDIGALSHAPGELSDAEKRWVGYQPYLLSKGYRLRSRYQPDWVPSWEKRGGNPKRCEDGWAAFAYRTLDAIRIKDGKLVMIKMVIPSLRGKEGLHELAIVQRFSNEVFSGEEANHVVPLLDTFDIPDVDGGIFYVMPLLTRYDRPRFQTLNEVYDFLRQVFEGLAFLHQHDVAHCDIASPNILMDARPIYYEQFHPLQPAFSLDGTHLVNTRTRTQAPVKYYYIDFGYSVWNRDRSSIMIRGFQAREPVPEQMEGQPYDPFIADVYQLGAVLRRDLIPNIPTLRFLLPLARAMTTPDPQQRIGLIDAQELLHQSFLARGSRRLRWPLIPKHASFVQRVAVNTYAVYNELMILMQRFTRFGYRIRLHILGY